MLWSSTDCTTIRFPADLALEGDSIASLCGPGKARATEKDVQIDLGGSFVMPA